ncbi:MAG: endo alpha-1,4 polygalactosaminidase, partial [Myxococcota bacterium]
MGRAVWMVSLAALLAGCEGEDDDDDRVVPEVPEVPDGPADLDEAPPPQSGTAYPLRTTWHWQDSGAVGPVDADLVLRTLDGLDAAGVSALQAAGHAVFCTVSVGRDGDWVDVTRTSGVDFALGQLDAASALGCDGVAPTDVDGPWDPTARRAFVRHVYNEAHARGLDVAQLGGPTDVADLVDYADLVIAPGCHAAFTCEAYAAYTEAGKPVLNAEFDATFRDEPAAFCRDALIATTRSIVLDEALDGSFRVSCDTDFPTTTRLSGVQTYTTYYGRDASALDALADLDLAIVQPLLTGDQRLAIQARGPVVAYLSIGEIGLSNTYVVDGEEVLGQVIYDAHPDWFLGENPFFDSWFADTTQVGWQDFVLGQAAQLHDLGYDGLFMDTVDTVDVYPDTIGGMVELIARLRTQHPDGILVQNRGMNVIPMSGPDVDALMFEVFSTRYDFDAETYARTDVTAPGYPEIVQKAVDYRLSGGVVLAQDFGDETTGDDLLCYARERALLHRFVPAYADKFFVAPPRVFPAACPWVEAPRPAVAFSPRVAHLTPG